MSNDIHFSTFPSNECQALAMLYIQSLDLSNLSPEDIYDKYRDAYERIRNHRKEANKVKRVQTYGF